MVCSEDDWIFWIPAVHVTSVGEAALTVLSRSRGASPFFCIYVKAWCVLSYNRYPSWHQPAIYPGAVTKIHGSVSLSGPPQQQPRHTDAIPNLLMQ